MSAAASPDSQVISDEEKRGAATLECPLCGLLQKRIPLRPGERAMCCRCGTTLARGSIFRRHSSLSFAVTGFILGMGAVSLPFIEAEKFGNERTTLLFAGVAQTWEMPMYFIAFWVLLCGGIMPLLLLAALIVQQTVPSARRDSWWCRLCARTITAVDHWAIPEVQVLAILVAMIKLGSLINVHLLAGFWFYVGMALAQLIAWRSYLYVELHTDREAALEAGSTAATS